MGDTAELMFGELAEKRGPALKDFGVMLVQDHTPARDQASSLAKSDGVEPPSGLQPARRGNMPSSADQVDRSCTLSSPTT